MAAPLPSIEIAELALKLFATRGAPSYWAYVSGASESAHVLEEMADELRALDERLSIKVVDSSTQLQSLMREQTEKLPDVLLVAAQSYAEAEWAWLDRRRSLLERAEGAMVFIATPENFDLLMRTAPNLASWLGGLVFMHEDSRARIEARRESRLETLRSWFGKTDEDVEQEAAEGRLPRDPAYAEWLSLLGRGDLIDV
jgi:hypothetical protein